MTNIQDLRVITHNIFTDDRGSFTELTNESNESNFGHIRQLSISYSKKGVLRGLHCSPYAKLVKCLKGKVYDVVVDFRDSSPTYGNIFYKTLTEDENTMIFIPPNCGHGFYCEEDACIQYIQMGSYDKTLEKEVNCLCPELNIKWPQPPIGGCIMSEKDRNNPKLSDSEHIQNDFLIFGGSGLIGSHVIKVLKEHKRSFYVSKVRIESYSDILDEIDRIHCQYIICCAGVAGKPNISWCEDNQPETIMANIIGQINIANACLVKKKHCVLFGTGILYSGNKDRDLEKEIYDEIYGTGITSETSSLFKKLKIYTELDTPNSTENFYVRQRIILEKLLESYNHVLNLRILYPITSDMNPTSLIPKLLKYRQISGFDSSYTVIDDLFQYIPPMCDMEIKGTYNFANPGFTNNREILELYKEYVDPSITWENTDNGNKAHPILDVSKLLKLSDGCYPKIPNIKDSLVKVMERIKEAGFTKIRKPSILIFGANGMLGRYISRYLEQKKISVFKITRKEFNILESIKDTEEFIKTRNPTHIINCAGVINKRPDLNKTEMYIVNANFPKVLDEICEKRGIILVHPTTDCIFSGSSGFYRPDSVPDCHDDYSMSKLLGEKLNHACIIRCSIIGEEENNRSLVSWILSNRGKNINGYTNHIWNGITCLEYAKMIHEMVMGSSSFWKGIKHIASPEPMSKYDLVKTISQIYNLDIKVYPIETPEKCDRSLKPDIIRAKSLYNQIIEMRDY